LKWFGRRREENARVIGTLPPGTAARAGLLALLAASSTALAQEREPAAWSASLTLVSDFRFRGISQSWREPALQGQLQYDHAGGWYGGLWASQVSGNVYPGARFEVDYYAGYAADVAYAFSADAGLVHYSHPGARAEAQAGSPAERFDGSVGYLDLGWREYGIKYWHGLHGGARGSRYLELYANFELGRGYTLALHAGEQTVREDPAFGYRDWRVSLSRQVGDWTLGLAYSDTDAERDLYYVGDASRTRFRQIAGPAWVAWISREF
jgi:uncharacterized protein (TIGR02001 family)